MVSLPRGVGVVRIQSPLGVVTLISDRLTRLEEEVGRTVATALSLRGMSIVILSVSDIEKVLRERAA